MSYLAPLGISLAGGLGSSLLGNLFGGRSLSPTERAAQGNLLSNMTQGRDLSNQYSQMAQGALTPALNYWSRLLSGDRGAATSVLAPQIEQINQGYDAVRRSQAELMPYGGGRASLLSELPYQKMRDIQNLFQQIQPTAAQNLGQLGTTTAAQGIQSLLGSTSAGQSLLGYSIQKSIQDRLRGQDIGAGLFSMFQQYGMPALQKRFPGIFGDMDTGKGTSANS